jgi:DNA-binding PucR family transcriptional regulator
LATGFFQAAEALELGQRVHPKQTVHHYLDIGMLRILTRNGDRSQIDLFIRHTLGKLLDYDREKNAHLVETLAAILKGRSLHSVAEELYVHPKTLLFRKHRIEEIMGESLDNPLLRMNLELAFQLNELRGKR